MICIFKLYHLLVKICIHLIDDNNAYRLLIAVLQLHASIQSFNGAEGNIKKKPTCRDYYSVYAMFSEFFRKNTKYYLVFMYITCI